MKSVSFLTFVVSALAFQNVAAYDDDKEYVTCGSAIKLSHTEKNAAKFFLSSGGHRINAGSGQQLITATPETEAGDSSTLWLIREASSNGKKFPCVPGKPIPYGTPIRLTHVDTNSNLHSHNVRSPLSNQQEITGYGNEGEGDSGDDWVVNPVKGSERFWLKGDEVFLEHKDTGKFLGCSDQAKFTRNNCGRNCPVMNHLEAFGRDGKDSFTRWSTELGIYLSL